MAVLRGVLLWDGERERGLVDLTWSETDDRVEGVAPATAVPGAASADPPLAVVPGLVDTHVHLVGESTTRPSDFLTWPLTTRREEQVLHALAHARAALAGGVTTLRDLAADEVQFSLARALDAGVVPGPRVLAHGLVSMTGGHGDLFTPPAVACRPRVADGVDECRRLVRHWARAGADGIKVATSGGVLSVGDENAWRNHTDAELAAIVDEAHALGMLVAAHAHTALGIERALDAGVDSVEHGTVLEAPQAARLAERGTTVAPTLLVNDRIAAGGPHLAPAAVRKARELLAQRDPLLREAAARGVRFVLGTDANGSHVRFGEQMAEVRRMAEVLGIGADAALRAATSQAGAAVGRPELGRIAVGGPADLLVVRGRPWRDVEELRTEAVVAVVSRGQLAAGSLPPEQPDQPDQ